MNLQDIKNNKKFIFLIALVAVFILAIVAVALISSNSSDNRAGNSVQSAVNAVGISTPYCDLYYPEEYAGSLKTEVNESEHTYTVHFYSTVKEEMKLFSVVFRDAESDNAVGAFMHNDTKMWVSVEVSELVFGGTWSEEEKNKVYAMQECINDVLNSINETVDYI